MQRKLYVVKKLSKKEEPYFAVCYDNGYSTLMLSFDTAVALQISGLNVEQLYSLDIDQIHIIMEVK